MPKILEIRTYRLKPGTNQAFHNSMLDNVIPLIRSKGMDVVAFGSSDHEQETYFLIRAYANRQALDSEQEKFYSSEEWRTGPRNELIAHIETYVNTLISLDDVAVENLRNLNSESAFRSSLLE